VTEAIAKHAKFDPQYVYVMFNDVLPTTGQFQVSFFYETLENRASAKLSPVIVVVMLRT